MRLPKPPTWVLQLVALQVYDASVQGERQLPQLPLVLAVLLPHQHLRALVMVLVAQACQQRVSVGLYLVQPLQPALPLQFQP